MNSTKQKRTSLKILLACLVLLITQITTQTYAREMQPGSDAYTFSVYMIDAFYSEGEECEEKLLATPTIGWLCAAFPLGERAFEQRWDAYLSALPQDYSITAVTSWGDIRYEEDDSVFYGKVYDLNDGRLVVGYDRSDRGREIRLGFSSKANQATATQNQVAQASASTTQSVQPVTQPLAATQPPVVPQAQAIQAQTIQTQTEQQAPVFLTQAETRAREIAQAAAQAQNTIVNSAQTNQTTNQTANQTANQRAYATTTVQTPAIQSSNMNSSAAMTNAAATTMATSAVVNGVNTVNAAPSMPQATSSAAMSNARTTNLATSSVVTAPLPVAPMQTPLTAAPVQTVQQAVPQAQITQVNSQEVMALAQPKTTPQATTLTASGILDVFREKGLSVSSAKEMTPKDYGFAPVLASEGLFFRLGDCTSCIGRIFSFDRKEDVAMMEVYYSLEAQATDVVYSQDKILIQFFSTPKDLADQYISELKALN